MSLINALTAAQEARLGEFRDRWIRIGLSTEPANRERAEAAIRQMYRRGGIPEPRKIVWCGSPLSQGLTRAIILDKRVRASVRDSVRDSVWASVRDSVWASVWDSVRDSVWASVRDSVWDSVRDSVWASVGASVRDSVRDSVWASVGDSVWASVGASVWASVRDSVRDSVWASVGDSVWASVRDSVRDSVWASVGDSVRDSGYGQHDANWLGFYAYFREVCDLQQQTEKLDGLIEQAQHAGWYLPHQHICWVSERHHVLMRDERGRLHCEMGPAVMYPDGWAIYAWHGVRVPEAIIETPESITEDAIFGESNAEIRRVMIERYGKEKLLGSQRLRRVDIDAENLAELYRVDLGGVEWGLLSLTCHTTGHTTVIWTRPEYRSAREALARSYGLRRAEEYKPGVQT